MHVPLPWAAALVAAATMLVVLVLAIAVRLGGLQAHERRLLHVAHLLGGTVTGFVALAFPPAWPVLAFVGGTLAVGALRDRRTVDLGMHLSGFGAAWVLLLGKNVVTHLANPAVYGSPLGMAWLAAAACLLVAGLVLARRGTPRRA